MSQQAGIFRFDRETVPPQTWEAFDRDLAQQGPDRRGEHQEPGLAMLHRAFYITPEDTQETQPVRTPSGDVVTWDGRLDNRGELLALLGKSERELPTDAEIVTAALIAMGVKALPKIVGDWALTWWNPRNRRLTLARDYIGIRTLYCLHAQRTFYWSTSLASLVLHSGERFSLSDPYFAGYLASLPEAHLTPYAEIVQVPPGAYVQATPSGVWTHRYWSFDRLPATRYRSDAEYEEHFRDLFRQSVKRRLRSAYPILAELSGGLDSSCIVCMAHDILQRGESSTTMDTVSYYSFGDVGCDERPYFQAIETYIGKTGTHFEEHTEASGVGLLPMREPWFTPVPGYFDRVIDGERYFLDGMPHREWRIRFSGIGGDELLGGIQNPIPDLAKLLWSGRLNRFGHEVHAWALQRKTTVWSLLGNSLIQLAPIWLREHLDKGPTGVAEWLRPKFVRRQNIARRRLRPSATRREWLPGPPSLDSDYLGLAASIAGYLPRFTMTEQTVLPYYDRDLVQFLLTIPGEQLLRPTQRRSLMRRSLAALVPEVVLKRKTKALGRRLPSLELTSAMAQFLASLENTPSIGKYVSTAQVKEALEQVSQGKELPPLPLERLLGAVYLCGSLAARDLLKSSGDMPAAARILAEGLRS